MSKPKKSIHFEWAMEALKQDLHSQCTSLGSFAWNQRCILEWLTNINALEPYLIQICKKNALFEVVELLEEIEDRGFLKILENFPFPVKTKLEQQQGGTNE